MDIYYSKKFFYVILFLILLTTIPLALLVFQADIRAKDINYEKCVELTKYHSTYGQGVELKKIHQGKPFCEETLAAFPDDEEIQFAFARILKAEKNYNESFKIFDSLRKKNNMEAFRELSDFHYFGYGDLAQDLQKSYDYTLKCAEANLPDCIHDLSHFYNSGKIVESNFDRGIQLLEKASESGSSQANIELGDAYFYEYYNLEQNIEKSKEYYEIELSRDNPAAKGALGSIYLDEPKSKLDIETGLNLYEAAAIDDDPWALSELARLNLMPSLSTNFKDFKSEFQPNKRKGLSYYLKLIESEGVSTYNEYLLNANMIDESLEFDELKPILKKLDDIARNPEKTHNYAANIISYDLARFYYSNPFITENLDKVIEYYTIAADRNHDLSAINLAWIYYDTDETRNLELAEKYSKIAIKTDDLYYRAQAYNNLGVILSFSNDKNKIFKALDAYLKAIEILNKEEFYMSWPYHNVIEIYYVGTQGINKNYEKAKLYLENAKTNEYDFPFWDFMFETFGDRLPKNEKERELYFTYAALNGHTKGFNVLGFSFEEYKENIKFNKQLGEAYKWFYICTVLCSDDDDNYDSVMIVNAIQNKIPGVKLTPYLDDAQNWIDNVWTKKEEEKNRIEISLNLKEVSNQYQNYALLIGNDIYQNLTNLENPSKDINRVGEILEKKFGYNVKKLKDASRKDITKSLNEYVKNLKENDNFILYYSGHGDENTDEGFWLPVDADTDDDTNWIANSYITRKLRQIKAKNILIIADSCYSGTLTRGLSLDNTDLNSDQELLKLYKNNKTRVVISSGGEKPVLDGGGNGHSVFARSLITELENRSDIFTATNLFTGFNERVTKNSSALGLPQIPRFADIPNSGHEDMDFIFSPIN